MKYLKVWTSFRDVMENLNSEEKGRLFDAMLEYAETGKEPENLTGNDFVIWPAARQSIDLTAEKNAKLKVNGSKGGTAKAENQRLANDSKTYQSIANVSNDQQTLAEKKRKEKKGNEKKGKETESSFLDDDDAAEIQREHDRVFLAAEDAGFKMSNTVRARLISLYTVHGLNKLLDGFMECATHGVPTIAYLEAVLKGKPKQKPAVKVLPVQDFPQRDYSSVEDEMMANLAKEVEAMRNGNAG